ncbi:hypothetical protein FRC06_004628 [Ceratobasidium sp. 370]|nr:hypothetical protein FRC06_004628 [Ceratobasidium sp. 370]
MPPKRKLDLTGDDDDEVPSLGNRVLPVANLPDDFNGEPEDGAQYLFLVRRDALNLPHTTRADNPYAIPMIPPASAARKPPHPCIPSEEWRSSFEGTFKNFRQASTSSWRASRASRGPEGMTNQAPKVPRPRDRDGWLQFLNGSIKSPKKSPTATYPPSAAFTPRSVLGAKFGVPMTPEVQPSTPAHNIQEAGIIDDEPGKPIKQESDEIQASSSSEPQKPIPSIIKNMDDNGAIYLLMFIAHWIRKSLENISSTMPPHPLTRPFYFPRHHQQWAFALLAQLDTSLRSEEISHLRELARACIAAIREDLDLDGPVEVEVDAGASFTEDRQDETTPAKPDSARYAHLTGTWMIVGAIASVWGQRDMWEHAEEALGELVVVKPRALTSKTCAAPAPAPTPHTIPSDRPDPELDVVLNYG